MGRKLENDALAGAVGDLGKLRAKMAEAQESPARTAPEGFIQGPAAPETSTLPASLPLPDSPRPSPPTDVAEKAPRWHRPEQGKTRRRVARILFYKLQGKGTDWIAKKLNTTPGTIRHYLYLAGKNGWLRADTDGLELMEPGEALAFNTAHKVVKNIDAALDGHDLSEQQQQMTIEVAKGIGLFKSHQVVKGEQQQTMVVVGLKLEQPPIQAGIDALPPASVGGAPIYIEGEVSSGEQSAPANVPDSAPGAEAEVGPEPQRQVSDEGTPHPGRGGDAVAQ